MSYIRRSCIEDETTFGGDTKKSLSGGIFLMQHTNAILKRLYSDVKNLRRSNAIDFLHRNVYFEEKIDITSKSIKQIRDHMKIYIEIKQKRAKKTKDE